MIAEKIKINCALHGGYLESGNIESDLLGLRRRLKSHNHWVKHLGGRTIQPFALVEPGNTPGIAYWANLVTGTLHSPVDGYSLSGTLKIQFRAKP